MPKTRSSQERPGREARRTPSTCRAAAASEALRSPRASEGGWSLLESAVAMALLAVTIMGIASVITLSFAVVAVNRESATAMEAARQVLEVMTRQVPPGQLFAAYNGVTEDDPPGLRSLGASFNVPNLPGLDHQGPATGRIYFPVHASAPGSLREDVEDAGLGMPRDLNGDGEIDDANHAADYLVLPVLVKVTWASAAGPRSVSYRTTVVRY